MENVYSITEFQPILSQMQQQLCAHRYRMPLWIIETDPHSELPQCHSVLLLRQWLGEKTLAKGLWISSQPAGEFIHLSPSQYRKLLGREWPLIVIDARDGFRANLLAAAAGAVAAGGLLVIISTSLEHWLTQPCNETLRLFGKPLLTTGLFLPRLVERYREQFYWVDLAQGIVEAPRKATYRDDAFCSKASLPIARHSEIPSKCASGWRELAQQQQVIERIKQVFTGHAKRPCVVTADRGRGKSSALGVAVAELVNTTEKKFVITAPNPQACQQVFHWFNRLVPEELQHHLIFLAPDELIERLNENKLAVDGVLVDEAAAIPVPMLTQLLKKVNRIVFSSTIHGYEGNGRGFAIRFTSALNTLMPNWRHLQLVEPIRWNAGDPLEAWVSQVLLLVPPMLDSDQQKQKSEAINEHPSVSWRWIEPQQSIDEVLLTQAFCLLVESHYQTTPDDLRQLMDHPERSLLIGCVEDHVIAVAMLLKEGQLEQELAQQVALGKRRARGQLTPQTLAYHLRFPELAELSGWRVQRIAVRAEFRRQAIGKHMLDLIEKQAADQQFDYVSSSFAASNDLIPFWTTSGYRPVRLGLKRDKASGCHSLLVIKPLSENSQWNSIFERFYRVAEKLLASTFRQLDPRLVVQLWQVNFVNNKVSNEQRDGALAFARGESLLEDVIDDLHALLNAGLCLSQKDQSLLEALEVLIAAIWQCREPEQLRWLFGVKGRQQIQETLQLHVQTIVDRITAD